MTNFVRYDGKEDGAKQPSEQDFKLGRYTALYLVICFTAFALAHHLRWRRGWIWPILLWIGSLS